jgi:ubiquinone/menaquinone biosynthesis C-methylase UbiE
MSHQAPDWDALALYWEHFEDGGFNRRMLAVLEPLVRPPVLYVGGGLGTLPNRLAGRFGKAAVHSVDRSEGMCRRARRDFGINCVVAEAAGLPFLDGSFVTVLCATGVLEFMEQDELISALAEMGRVCASSGDLLVTAACSDGSVHWGGDQHRLVEAWYANRFEDSPESARAFNAIASAIGSRDAAREFLLRTLPRVGRAITTAEMTVAAGRIRLEVAASRINDDGIGLWRLGRYR